MPESERTLSQGVRVSAYLRVGYLRGFLGQTAALRWDQVVVLSADILI